MKKLSAIFAIMLCVLFSTAKFNEVKAQTTSDQLVENLITLQEALIAVDIDISNVTVQDLVDIGDINITDFIDVQDVLNRNEINVLNIQIGDITIDNVLTNVLRDANILNRNQVVVGILSDGSLVIATTQFLRAVSRTVR